MSASRPIPPAPAPGVVPLPTPRDPTKKGYSEGSMYEDLSAEDVEAWHRRYAEFKRWRQEIPNKGARHAGVGTGSSMSWGAGVGVGSSPSIWRESSDSGTLPSTVVEGARQKLDGKETGGDLRIGKLQPQAEAPAPTPVSPLPPSAPSRAKAPHHQARVSTQSHSTTQPSVPTSKVTIIPRPPLKQKTSIPQKLSNSQNPAQPIKAPTIEIQPPSSKTPKQQLPTRHTCTARHVPSAAIARPPLSKTTIKPSKSSSHLRLKETPRISSVESLPSPGDLVVPSPTPSAKYAEREAYIHSALELPLDMLTETADGIPPRTQDSSSQLTTSRLGSLLGNSRGNLRGPGGGESQRSSSSTTLPSGKSERIVEVPSQAMLDSVQEGKLSRSKTTSAVPERQNLTTRTIQSHREYRYEASDHLPVPGTQPRRSRPPTEATGTQNAQYPQPSSIEPRSPSPNNVSAPSSHSRQTAAGVQPQSVRQPIDHVPSEATVVIAVRAPLPPSEATVIRATREPLPLSVPTTSASHAETIKVPVSVKTVVASSAPLTRAPTTAATVTRATQVALPASVVTNRNGSTKSRSAQAYNSNTPQDSPAPLSPRQIPLPSTVLMATSTAPTHRQQMPLPRPALTPQSSFDGLGRTLSRRHRDPSLPDLTARFQPEMYPLPPSGMTIFSSPEHIAPQPAPEAVDHEVVFTTVEYIPRSEGKQIETSVAPSTPAQPAHQVVRTRSARSAIPTTPGNHATNIPLPPSTTTDVSAASPQRAMPSAPVPSLASPPTGPPALGPSTAHSGPPPPSKGSADHQPSRPTNDPPGQTNVDPQIQSAREVHPHIHFSPGQISQSLSSEDEHVSFEVPSGSRGRLRVTLKWLRDGTRSERSSPRAGRRLSVVDEGESTFDEEKPPPLPPKTSSLISRVIGKSPRRKEDERKHPQTSSRTTSVDRRAYQQVGDVEESRREHPIEHNHRPELDAASPKRDNPKSASAQDHFPPDQQAQQQHHPSGPAPHYNPNLNPYYSGATLPAYRPQMPQVYNMLSSPFGYPQPPPGAVPQMGWGAYRPMVPPLQLDDEGDRGSMAGDSVDPPSDHQPPAPVPSPNGQYPVPDPTMGMMNLGTAGFPQPNQSWYPHAQAQEQNQVHGKPSIWQKMFQRRNPGFGEGRRSQMPNGGPEDNVTIKNWRNGVSSGRAPTVFPNNTPHRGPLTVRNELQRLPIAGTVYLGGAATGADGQSPMRTGPGTTLYDARYGNSPPGRSRGRKRERSPSVWEKLMYRRQVDEAVYASPSRRRGALPDPAPPPPKSRNGLNARGFFSPRNVGRDIPLGANRYNDRDKQRDRAGVMGGRGDTGYEDSRRAAKERRAAERAEKEERRRQRAERRNERAKGLRSGPMRINGPGSYPYAYTTYPTGLDGSTPNPTAGGNNGNTVVRDHGLKRDGFGRAESRDRPLDMGGRRGGKSGTMVGDWVGALGGSRLRGRTQFPDSQTQVRDYRPTQWKDRLKFNRSQTVTEPGATTYGQPQPQAQPRLLPRTQPQRQLSRPGRGQNGLFSSFRQAQGEAHGQAQGLSARPSQKLKRGGSRWDQPARGGRGLLGLGLNLGPNVNPKSTPNGLAQAGRSGQSRQQAGYLSGRGESGAARGSGSGVRSLMGRFGVGGNTTVRR